MPALTAASVTDKQIQDLRAEAVQVGDWRQVDLCDVALGIRPQHTATDRGSIKDSSGRSITRAKARSACAKVISYAQSEAGHGASPSRHHATKKSPAQLQREINETLRSHSTKKSSRGAVTHATKSASEAMVARMTGRHVKSGWHGLVDGEIIQWEPFGAGGTDVLVKDVASGHLTWHASHGLTPIDDKGPLPSRSAVRRIREAEMKESMKKIGERWAKEPPPPRIRR